MRSRWDMQDDPPDILITNYSMLSIMMMREIDDPIFKKTREWLEEDKENHLFHLIVDELHLYRGTAGAEVAYLLRLFLHRLGLSPDSSQLRILASSASLNPRDENSLKFLKDFFGSEWIFRQIITGEFEVLDKQWGGVHFLPKKFFSEYSSEEGESFENLQMALGVNSRDEVFRLIKNIIQRAFYKEDQKKSISIEYFAKKIFDDVNEKEAVGGLFQFLGKHHDSINLSFRFHLFFLKI